MLIFHISHLKDGDLAKDMLEEQVANNWPGLAKEVEELVKILYCVFRLESGSTRFELLLSKDIKISYKH